MVSAADRAAEIGASALQVFSDNPTSWRRRPALPRELPAFRQRLADHGLMPLSIHAPYLVNLAGPDPDFHEQSVQLLVNELRVAHAYGAAFLNVHIGSHRGAGLDAGVARLSEGVARVFDLVDGEASDTVLVLENGAGGGFGIGTSVDELARIDREITAAGVARERYGFCLDTAHLWGAGYAIGTTAGVDDLLERFDGAIGIGRLRMVHLNDSRSELGSRSDRHEHLGAGSIGRDGLARMATHPALDHVAYFLETPGMDDGYDAVNIARLQDIVAGRPLAGLPPEAFHTRSAKGRSAPADEDVDEAVDGAEGEVDSTGRTPGRGGEVGATGEGTTTVQGTTTVENGR